MSKTQLCSDNVYLLTPPPRPLDDGEKVYISPPAQYTDETTWESETAFVNTRCYWCGLACTGDTLKSKYVLSVPISIKNNDDVTVITMANQMSFNSFACLTSHVFHENRDPDQNILHTINYIYQKWNPDAEPLDMMRCRAPLRRDLKEFSGSSGKTNDEYIEELCA